MRDGYTSRCEHFEDLRARSRFAECESVGSSDLHSLPGGSQWIRKIDPHQNHSRCLVAGLRNVELDGHDVTKLNPLARINFGLSVIYQDFALLPNLSVFENITFLDSVSRHRKWVDFRLLHREAAEIVARMKVQIPLDALVEDLPVANQQLVAIGACAQESIEGHYHG